MAILLYVMGYFFVGGLTTGFVCYLAEKEKQKNVDGLMALSFFLWPILLPLFAALLLVQKITGVKKNA